MMFDNVGWNRKTALVLLGGALLILGICLLVSRIPLNSEPADATAITYGPQGVSFTEIRVPKR